MRLKITQGPTSCKALLLLWGLLAAGSMSAQVAEKTIRGAVRDELSAPVAGATVLVPGTQRGTTTNAAGTFEFRVPRSAQGVQVSFPGYKTVMAAIGSGDNIEVRLEVDAQSIEDVVVIGYGTVRKQDLTGAVGVLSTEDKMESLPVLSVDQFMQGRMAGVNISSNSGAPGADMSVQIRGVSTLSGDTQPLYVIDGFPIEATTARSSGAINELSQQPSMNPLAAINPNDIESIQALKDASATAIYGSRATNGVVIITTRQGKEGAMKVNYNSRVDISQVARKYDLLNAYEYGLYENELGFTDKGYDMYGEALPPSSPNPKNSEEKLDHYRRYSTDWQDLMYRTSVSHDQQLSISGGSKASSFSLTGGYTKQEGIILNTGLERYSARFNYKHDLTNRLKFSFTSSYSRSEQQQTSHSQPSSVNQMIRRVLTTKPTLMPETIDTGEEVLEGVAADNPYKMATELKDILLQQFVIVNASLTYKLMDGLNLKVAGNLNNVYGKRKSYYPTGTNAGNTYHGMGFQGDNSRENYVFESLLSYNKTIAKGHRIDAVGGWTAENRIVDNLQVQAADFADNDLLYWALGEGLRTAARSSSHQTRKMSSFLGRVNYSLLNRYIFTVTGRYDGSSLLAEGNRWKFFPSGAVAWRLDQEQFMKSAREISNLKLRLSYGLTGNQNIGYTASVATMNHARLPVNGSASHGMTPGSMANPDLGWESTASTNIGVDLGVFDNRYRLNVDMYRRVTRDLLLNFGLPPSNGYGSIPVNLGQISNHGVEVELAADILTKTAVKWTVSANWFFNRNKVDKLGGNRLSGATYLAGGGAFNQSVHMTMEGYPIGAFYGYVFDGIYQTYDQAVLAPIDSPQATPGSIRWLDISGPDGVPDGRITADDMTILGYAEPSFNCGLGSDLSWKGLKLSLQINGSYGGKVANLNRYVLDAFDSNNNNVSRKAWEGRWTGPGTSNKYPAVNGANASTFFQQRFSNMLLEDASYLKLRTVQLTYAIPTRKIMPWLRSLSVFATATNLLTITGYSGYDPEVSITTGAMSPNVDYAAYPSCKTWSFGINIGF